jgi:glutamate formiminotransferase
MIASRFGIPVFLYGEAATSRERQRLENVRRGGFEGLAERMAARALTPDYGPAIPHPTAGATAVGARRLLVAYNINLATTDLSAARRIAARVRESNGGLPCVKALGLTLAGRGLVQVSMNLTDYEVTPIARVFDAVSTLAREERIDVAESEIVGLVPAAALADTTEAHLRLSRFSSDQILEHRLAAAGLSDEH